MKDGSDGESFAFKLKVVELGIGSDGEAESSCVVEHVENAPDAPSKRTHLGARESILLGLLKTMAPSGTVDREDLVEGYKAKTPKPDGRDQRRSHAITALTSLVAKRLAYMHGEDRVSLTSLLTQGDFEGWLK